MGTSIIEINSNPSSFLPKLVIFRATSPNRDGFWRKQQKTSLPHFPAPLPLGDMNKSGFVWGSRPPGACDMGFFRSRIVFGWKLVENVGLQTSGVFIRLTHINPLKNESHEPEPWHFKPQKLIILRLWWWLFFRMLLRLMTFYPGHHSPQYKGMKMSIGKSSSQPSKEVASWFPRMIRWWFWRFTKDTKTHKRNRLNPPEKARSPQLLQLESPAPRKVSRIPNRRMLLVMEGILHQVVASLPVYPTIYRVLYIPGGAGFLPSTVCRCLWYLLQAV